MADRSVGAGDDRAYAAALKAMTARDGLGEKVHLRGVTSDMAEVWKETDIFAFPSHHEGFPLALTEAMSAGIPAVGFRSCPAVNELIRHGENGLLCEDGEEAFREALRTLMEDPEKRRTMGKQARKRHGSLQARPDMGTVDISDKAGCFRKPCEGGTEMIETENNSAAEGEQFITSSLPRLRIAVIGDVMLDRYVFGKVSRISPEAPVPVNLVESERSVPGGAANTAANLSAMGVCTELCGLCGNDESGRRLFGLLEQRHIGSSGILTVPGFSTTAKMRILGSRQQMLRLDFEEKRTVI